MSSISQQDLKIVSTYYLVGTLFNKGMSFLTVPIFSRLLSTSDYGIITTYNSWVSIISMIVSCALYMGVRAAFVDYEKNIDDFMSSITTFNLISGIAVTTIIMIFAQTMILQYPKLIILLCLIHSIGAGLIQNYSMYLMMQYRYKFRTALLVLPNLLAVLFSLIAIIFVVKDHLYMGRIVPTSLVQGFFGLIVVILVYRKSHVYYDFQYIRFALTLSLPLVLHGIALNILSQSDRLMISSLRSTSETGIYSLIYNFGMIATVITTALDGVWVPWFTNALKQNEEKSINTRVKLYIEFMTISMAGLILIGPEIVKILADSKYWEGINIIPPIVLANYAIFAYSLYVNVEHFYKKTVYITINTLIAAACNIIANFIFIPLYGYVAAAYTTLFSYIISLLMHAIYARKLNENLYPISFFVMPGIKILISVVLFYSFIDSPILRWIIGIGLCLSEMFIHKDIIHSLFTGIRNR